MERRYSMRIAVSYKDGEVFQHFGHSSEFKIYETDHNEIIKSKVITVEGHGHVSVSNALKEQNVNIVLCGGIGQGLKLHWLVLGFIHLVE